MNKNIPILFVALALLSLASCSQSQPTIQDDNKGVIEFSDAEFHTILQSGLNIDVYELEENPLTEPLTFVPVGGKQSQVQILALHEKERKQWFPDNSSFVARNFEQKIQFGDKELMARHVTNPNLLSSASIEVMLDEEVVYIADTGDVSPINPLRGLWSHNENWFLEYANITVTYDESENTAFSDAIGHLVKNGVLLNEQYSFEEAFGFQLMNGKPFYFFERNGQIGIAFDQEETLLGFEEIPHYGCCSAGMLNPIQAEKMVSFFAQKDNTWYYVEIGVYQ